MDSSHMSAQLSSACNHYKYDSKQQLKDIFSRYYKSVLGDIDSFFKQFESYNDLGIL